MRTCIVHLLRNSFKYALKRDWAQIAKDLKRVYTAESESEAPDRFAEFSGEMGEALSRYYTAMGERVGGIRAVPAVRPGNEGVICTTSAIESINSMPGCGGR